LAVVKSDRSQVEELAGKGADQTVAYISECFVKQGWIAPDRLKIPRTSNWVPIA
jgi:hypothetical protein